MNNRGDRFLLQCKVNYFKGITPSNPINYQDLDYQLLIDIGMEYLNGNEIEEFANLFRESQYFVSLWAAHIIYDYGNPDNRLKKECLEVIKDYSEHPLNSKISEEETAWIKLHQDEFRNFK
ncbi:hypothetical protein [Pedobacter sp. KLB.chiD]|uniref:hypothetical protein n=1 Tax=Pedobacter sp. KLB.chiD TaxID=3387402 RepID=UPI00399B9E73